MLAEILKEMARATVDSGTAWFVGAGASAVAFILALLNSCAG